MGYVVPSVQGNVYVAHRLGPAELRVAVALRQELAEAQAWDPSASSYGVCSTQIQA